MARHIESITIYYEIHGNGHPLVLLHGFWPDHHIMKGCMEPIFTGRPSWQRIYLDLPGMGKTKGPEWLKNSDQMLDVVESFIAKIIPEQHFALVGLSYGAYLARGIVHRRPTLVDGLALLIPLIIPDFSKRTVPPHVVLAKDPEFLATLPPEDIEGFENFIVVQTQKVWERTRDEVDVGVSVADEPFLNRLQEGGYAFSVDIDAGRDLYEKPTLILMGRQDSVVGYRDAWRLIEKFPRATFAVLDRAGHNLQIEQDGLFKCLANEWLDRVEESL